MRQQRRLPAAYYRGGTSRALIFNSKDLPPNRADWAPIFLGAIGSPDPNGRQLDGLGGGISSLSKICIVAPSSHPEADVDYTFAQIGVKNSDVDYSSNCGNMTSAIGPYALESGLVKGQEENGKMTVRILNTNTGKLIHSTFPVVDGEAATDGDFAIDGVSGTAPRIALAFLHPSGSKTGKLLPTGNVTDELDGIKATCIDVGNPCVVVQAEDLGIDGTILPDAVEANPELLSRLDRIRCQASMAMGISKDPSSTPASIPKIVMVSRPTTHSILSGETMDKSATDLVVRAISVGQPHRAVPITVAMAVAAAGYVKGSRVHRLLSPDRVDSDGITLGHASGKIMVGANFDDQDNLTSAIVYRTARRLMEGTVYWK